MTTKFDQAYELRKQAVLDQLAQYQEFAAWDQAAQRKYLEQRFKSLIAIAVKSSWWQQRIMAAKLSSTDSVFTKLSKLPVLTRSDLQQYGEWMKVWLPGAKPNQYQTVRTSGSTGKPVAVSKYAPAANVQRLAIQLLDATWQQRDMSGAFAHFRVNTPDSESTLPYEPFCYLGETGPTYIRQLSGSAVTETLQFLADKQIRTLLVNPIALRLLANQQIHQPVEGIKLNQILTWGDKLETSVRESAKLAFNAKVCDRYSAEEVAYLAIQCPHAEHLHALQFFNYIEILNDKNQPCEIGELGRVVITAWQSFGMPLIRYELGDLAAWGKPCEFGINLPVLEPTIVRIRDISLDKSGKIVLPRIERTALTRIAGIADFQLVEFNDGVVVLVRTFKELTPAEITEIEADIAAVFPAALSVSVLSGTELDWLAIWKRQIVQRFDLPLPTPLTLEAMAELLTQSGQRS